MEILTRKNAKNSGNFSASRRSDGKQTRHYLCHIMAILELAHAFE
jgi:hypothetical protein